MKKISIPLFVVCSLLACTKKENEPKPLTEIEKICVSPFKYKSITFSYAKSLNGITSNNGLVLYPCVKDDVNTFNFDGTVLENDNNNLCSSQKITIENYKIINNQLIWGGQVYDIKLNDGISLVLYQQETISVPSITTVLVH